MRLQFKTKEEWLEARKGKITSTKTAAILGCSPYMDNVTAYNLITGKEEEPDLSDNERVQQGSQAEEHIRRLWAISHKDFIVEDNSVDSYDLWVSDKYNYIAASGDGKITEISTGKTGIMEIKHIYVDSKAVSEQYKNGIPQHYYVQCLQEMYCSNSDFVIFVVCMNYSDDYTAIKTYRLDRKDCEDDLKYVEEKDVEFYNNYVVKSIRPPLLLNI